MNAPNTNRPVRSTMSSPLMLTLFLMSLPGSGNAVEPSPDVRRDIVYAEIDGHALALDLYLPKSKQRTPLIVWVHGGAWRAGSKKDMPLGKLVEDGFAVASVDYRLSTVARFPAQVHDIKAAIRFLRTKAADFGVDASRIAIAGSSAGGHLAALVGVTNGHAELEGNVGLTGASSDVQSVVSFYGMSDLTKILSQSTPHGLSVRVPALQLLLGGQPDEQPALAKLASPVFHLDAKDPPLLLIHGDQDPQAPFEQSRELETACKKTGVKVRFEAIAGAVHGGTQFYDDERLALVKKFLGEVIR